MKAVTVIGTRPEIIKMAPLIPLLDDSFEHTFLFTSQHYSSNMVEIFLNEMGVRRPDRFLNVADSDVNKLEAAIRPALEELNPKWLLIYGDTNSTLAAARAAGPDTAIVHIEAGIRSFDERMPEERNRIETDGLSKWRLAPTGLAKYFLTDYEGYPAQSIEVVGNLVVDAYYRNRDRILAAPLPEGLTAGQYCLLTMHRAENVDDPERLKDIMESLAQIPMTVVFPVHPRTEKRMRDFGLTWPENLRTSEPIGYYPFMRMMADCYVIITDSGGVQEEAITLGVPCVTLRDNTERMETVFLKANQLYDAAHRRDLHEVVQQMAGQRERIQKLTNPFGNGDSAERILAFLQSH